MLRIIAMVGDAEASAHIQAAVDNAAHLQFVRDPKMLAEQVDRDSPDVVVLGVREAGSPGAALVVRDAIGSRPATRILLVCHLDRPDVSALAQVRHLDIWDVILPRNDSAPMTRRLLLAAKPGHVADMRVRRLVCPRAPAWAQAFVEWCVDHDGLVRPDVRALAKVVHMRRETLARLFKARGACPPNHLISWMLVLRARARLDLSRVSLAAVAHELGLASGGSLANLIVRRTRQTPTQIRRQSLLIVADRAAREMFGANAEHPSIEGSAEAPIELRATPSR